MLFRSVICRSDNGLVADSARYGGFFRQRRRGVQFVISSFTGLEGEFWGIIDCSANCALADRDRPDNLGFPLGLVGTGGLIAVAVIDDAHIKRDRSELRFKASIGIVL